MKQPTVREILATLVSEVKDLRGDIGEIKDSVMGTDGCQRNHQKRISCIEGRIWALASLGGIGGVGVLLAKVLGWI